MCRYYVSCVACVSPASLVGGQGEGRLGVRGLANVVFVKSRWPRQKELTGHLRRVALTLGLRRTWIH